MHSKLAFRNNIYLHLATRYLGGELSRSSLKIMFHDNRSHDKDMLSY